MRSGAIGTLFLTPKEVAYRLEAMPLAPIERALMLDLRIAQHIIYLLQLWRPRPDLAVELLLNLDEINTASFPRTTHSPESPTRLNDLAPWSLA